MKLSEQAKDAMRQVLRELLADALRFYADDMENIAAMSHEALRDTLVAFIGREIYVRRMLGITGVTSPSTED